MRNISKRKFAAAVVVAAIATAAVLDVYSAREGAGGFAIWNRNEAYFFVHVDRRGYRSSYLLFPWILFKERVIGGFAAAAIPDDERALLVVIQVTPSGVERHIKDLGLPGVVGPSRYTPIDGRIYAFCGTVPCWWSGDHFENATEEEQRALMPDGVISRSRLTTTDFDDAADGWSRRVFVAGPTDRSFTIDVGSQFQLLLNNVGQKGTKNGAVSIDLLRPGKAAERIAEFVTREGRLSRSEYQHAFRDPE